MSNLSTEKLLYEYNQLNEQSQKEVFDFIKSLKEKEKQELEEMMDEIINENKVALEELVK